jgi:Mlc titration factor MtfA (ptsG expression regulator)
MAPTRPANGWPRITIGRVMLGIAILAVVLGLVPYGPRMVVPLLFLGFWVSVAFVSRPSYPRVEREPMRRASRRFRFSIWQIMAVVVFAAACSIMARVNLVAGLLAFVLFGMATLGVVAILRGNPIDGQGGGVVFGLSRKEQREKILLQPFPPDWSAILARNVPIYDRLSEVDKAELRGLIQVFLAEKVFEGCNGLEVTDEIRVTIAAQACLLLLRRETDVYPRLITVLVYPSAYVSNMPQHGPHGIVTEGPQGRLGEAWTSGVVVLSWDDVKLGASDVRDGHNVVFHEFAHQLDQEDGSSDGAPILPRRNMYSAWARVLGEEYQELQMAAETGKKSVLDTYGATEPAEFFAVATEAFFEKPVQLKKKHPELYEELKIYFNQDPEEEFGPVETVRPKL